MGIPAPLGVDASGLPVKGDQANAVLTGTLSAIGPGKCFAFRGLVDVSLWASINTALTTTAGSLAATVASASGLAVGDAVNSVNAPEGATLATIAGTNVTLALPPVTLSGIFTAGLAQISGLQETANLLGATVTLPGTQGVTLPAGTTVSAITTPAVASSSGVPGTVGTVAITSAPSAAPSAPGPVQVDFAVTANAMLTTGADANATFTGAAVEWVGTVQVEKSFDGGATWLVDNTNVAGTLAQFAAGTPVCYQFTEAERNVLRRANCTAYTSGVINYRFSQTGGAAESLAVLG